HALSSAEKQLSGLKTQMQQTWSTFPREVKDALQKEQQDWQTETQTICTSKRSQTEDQEASRLLFTQCMVAEYQQRIAALKKFQV
ncbi:MAG: lysozyme inhibitor LprI family protein, partial [Neisseriaceae bacterium]